MPRPHFHIFSKDPCPFVLHFNFSSPFSFTTSLSFPLQHQNRKEKEPTTLSMLQYNSSVPNSNLSFKIQAIRVWKTPRSPPDSPLCSPLGLSDPFQPVLKLMDICWRFSSTWNPLWETAGSGWLFSSCSLGLFFISSIVFTSASPSASFPAAGSLVLNHCSAPGAGFMPRSDGEPKAICKPPSASFSPLVFLTFCYPPHSASAATLLPPPPFWLWSYLGSGNMFRHLVAGRKGFGSGWMRAAR